MRLTLHTARLTASLADRTLTGLLLPFNEIGITNLGRLRATEASRLTLADGTIPLNVEHDPARPIGYASRIEPTPAGLLATFLVLPTRAGDDALTEAAAGLRAALSIEVDQLVSKAGHLISGIVDGAALVARPAFPSARLAAGELTDVPDTPDDEDDPPAAGDVVAEHVFDETTTYTEPDGSTITNHTETTTTTTVTDPKEPPMDTTTTTAPAVLHATALAPTPRNTTSKTALFQMIAGARAGDRRLLAALTDIVPGDILGIEQAQYIGELWSGKAYTRRVVPLYNHAELTSFKVTGWRWVTKPAVAAYAGNKTAVPSGAAETEAVDVLAERIAGAHDIDRKFRDFNNPEFWAAYFAAMTESYARVSDAAVLADVVAAATAVEAGVVPAGVPQGIVSIVDGVLAILNATDTLADHALVAPELWRDIALTRNEDALAYLDAAIGLQEGTMARFTIRPMAALGATEVLVGCKEAVTVHELGGEAPIRVEALNIANGGVDEGVFGYYAVNVHDADGLALVTPNVP